MIALFIRNNIGIISNLKLRILSVMPKNRAYISDLQKNRLKNREKKKGAVGRAYLQILGSGAKGAAKSVYLFTDTNRYMFNVGEGTQRLAHEHKIKISLLEHIFITTPIWENIGGLPGLALTIQECGVPILTLHGPTAASTIFAASKQFIVLNNLNIRTAVCKKDRPYQDDVIIVKYVPLSSNVESRCSNSSSITAFVDTFQNIEELKGDTDYHAYFKQPKNKNVPSMSSSLNGISANITSAPPLSSMAYICRLTPKLGELNLEKCVEKGVPPGPLLGKLKSGENISLPDGTVVKANDVKEPDHPGTVFIIVECPSLDFLDSLLNEEQFKKYQTEILDKNDIPQYIIHFTPSNVMDDERYQTWVKRFPEETLQINANDKNECLGCIGCHEMQYKLNMLDSKIFPLLEDDSIPLLDSGLSESENMLIKIGKRIFEPNSKKNLMYEPKRSELNLPDHVGNTLRILPLRPTDNFDFKVPDCLYLDPVKIRNDVSNVIGFSKQLEKLKLQLRLLSENTENIHRALPFPVITFLGTGSCIPNKCRNTSSILITLEQNNHILMDCGEGTYGQLIRHFGLNRAEKILAHLNIIFISHLHADHHIGLINVLKHRRKAVKTFGSKYEKVCLLAPHTMLFWLNEYQQRFEEILDCIDFIPNQNLEYRKTSERPDFKLYAVAPLKNIVTSYVVHCPHSFGISITDSNGCKITYSGDTMPSKDLLEIGKGSQLLIHEATFEDDLIGEARTKLHSTTSQAVDMGCAMEAEYTILTHFSQRYSKIPFVNDIAVQNVGIAFDNMEVTMRDLPKLHLFYPIFKMMYSEEHELLEFRNCKRKKHSLKFRG